MRSLGIFSLVVETAGQGQNGNPEGSLLGIQDARNFRKKILAARDEWTAAETPVRERKTLDDIYALLERIEGKMG